MRGSARGSANSKLLHCVYTRLKASFCHEALAWYLPAAVLPSYAHVQMLTSRKIYDGANCAWRVKVRCLVQFFAQPNEHVWHEEKTEDALWRYHHLVMRHSYC